MKHWARKTDLGRVMLCQGHVGLDPLVPCGVLYAGDVIDLSLQMWALHVPRLVASGTESLSS